MVFYQHTEEEAAMARLFGKRIMLREYSKADLPWMRKWVNDPKVVGTLSDAFLYPHTELGTEQFLNSMLEGKSEMKGFVIADKETAEYIGQIDLLYVDWKNRTAEMGIVVGRSELHGKGYGSEAIQLLQQFVFHRLNLNRLQLQLYDFNTAAYNCYIKCGFKEDGRQKQRYFYEGSYADVIWMGILKEDYERMEIMKGSS
jgi:RimJ/RimL family protein N-acetyltransferase